jgi:DNA-binding transcriptional LysR family regulator
MEEVAAERWTLSTVNMLPGHPMSRVFQHHGLPLPRVAVEARPIRIRLQVVACSDLLTFAPKWIIAQASRRFRLKEIPVKELAMRRPVGVLYRQDAYLPPAARRLIEILKAAGGKIAA